MQGESESEIKSGHLRLYHATRQYSTAVCGIFGGGRRGQDTIKGHRYVEVRKFQKKCKSDISGLDGGCASASTRIYYQEKL